jgi:SHS family lactate transporter-like MFS transporter
MMILDDLKALNKQQRAAFTASLLGWTLDAFDFFLLTFVIKDIAGEFHAKVSDVTEALFLTLALRPVGALVFGMLADRFGRKPVLQIDVLLYSAIAFASAFSPNLITLLVLRALFGFAMGGEWGVGASLTLESIPAKSRGLISGILQEGYAFGFILGALANLALPHVGWRGLLMFSALPALLVLYIRRNVEESPAWVEGAVERREAGVLKPMLKNWKMLVYAVVLMTAFNFFSHGTQDLFPTFLKVQHKFDANMVTLISVIANFGAIIGGITFGAWSEKIGRGKAIMFAAMVAVPALPFLAFSQGAIALAFGAFLVQISVQGAWGVVPAHLNELSPSTLRGFFPGFAYQLGNLLSSRNGPLQAKFAEANGNNYGLALAVVGGAMALLLAGMSAFGPERKGRSFTESEA